MQLIIAIMLLSACRMGEEPMQQVKGNFAANDIVFDAQNITQTAVKQCNDNYCINSTPIGQFTLHKAELIDKITEVLQFNDLHISFQLSDKAYTCLRRSASLGKMTLLYRGGDDNKYCYEQAKNKDYVQRFAAACVTAEGWQLTAGSDTSSLKSFACQKDQDKISSECFVAGNTANCNTSDWPVKIKDIHTAAKAASAQPPATGADKTITKDTLLKDVKVMAEWKLSLSPIVCNAVDKDVEFEHTTNKKNKIITFRGDKKVEDVTIDFSCLHNSNALPVMEYPAKGVCVYMGTREDVDENVDTCGNDGSDYIKITFTLKGE